jgi:hypothetical protein
MTFTSFPQQFNTGLLQDTPNFIEGLITEWSKDGIITVPNNLGATARVQTLTPDATTQAVSNVRLIEDVTGQTINVVTDSTPTATKIVTLLRTAWNANSVLSGLAVASGTATLILTDRQTGINRIPFNLIDNGSDTLTPVATVTTAATGVATSSFGRAATVNNLGQIGMISAALSGTNVLAGILANVLADIVADPYISPVSGFKANDAMPMVKKGKIVVRTLTAVDPTAQVWAIFSGADRGRFRATTAANASQVTNGLQWANVASAGSLVELRINLP